MQCVQPGDVVLGVDGMPVIGQTPAMVQVQGRRSQVALIILAVHGKSTNINALISFCKSWPHARAQPHQILVTP